MGSTVSRNDFIVTGCSPVAALEGSTQVSAANFIGDANSILALSPLPSVGVTFRGAGVYEFKIISPMNDRIITFTVTTTITTASVSGENSKDFVDIDATPPPFSPVVGGRICDTFVDRTIIGSATIRVIVFRSIPRFIRTGDLYTIDVVLLKSLTDPKATDRFINVIIARPKSSTV